MKRGKMLRSRVFEYMDKDMDMDIRMDKMSKVDRPTPPTRRQRVMAIHRVLIHSELKPALKLFLLFLVRIGTHNRDKMLVDPSRPQGCRDCLTWTKKEGIIAPVQGLDRRTTWEDSEVGRGRSMEEKKKGRVWLEVRLIRLGPRSWTVSEYERLGDRLVNCASRRTSAVLIPS